MRTIKRVSRENYKKVNVRQLAKRNPEQIVVVRTSSIYSQIARIGRLSTKRKEQTILADALTSASRTKTVNGNIIKEEPAYVPMKVKDVMMCFGNKIDKLQDNSQVYLA